jgi:hypothetical protein
VALFNRGPLKKNSKQEEREIAEKRERKGRNLNDAGDIPLRLRLRRDLDALTRVQEAVSSFGS